MIAGTPLALSIHRLRHGALIAALACAAAGLAGAFWRPDVFFPAYLAGYMFVIQLPIGCLGLLLLDHLVGGAWSAAIRRSMEAGVATFGWCAALFVPVAAGVGWLYPWARPDAATDPVYMHAAPYFNVPFFIIRALVIFGIWIGLSRLLLRWGHALEAEPTEANRDRLMSLSAAGLVAFGLFSSFAMIDWGMAVEPRWTSTIYPMMLIEAGMLAACALGIVTAAALAWRGPLPDAVPPRTWHDLGNILLTLLMTWGYLAFSQFLIIWSGDMWSENSWYVHRNTGGWGFVGLALIGLHFFLPFFILLSRQAKRHFRVLAALAGLMLAIHAVEVIWLVWPSFSAPGWAFSWLAVVAPAVPVGLWLWAYLGQLAARPVSLPPHASFGEVRPHA